MSEQTHKDVSTAIEMSNGTDLSVSTPTEGWNHGATPASIHPAEPVAHNRLHRAWDDYDAYLFDIDGTLMHCRDAVHYFAFCDVLSRTAGRPVNLDGIPVQGRIDPGILRSAFEHAGVPEELWLPRLPELLHQMADHVAAHAADFDIEVLPGVREALAHLQRKGKLLALGTGNLERIGWTKVGRCGLNDFFTMGAFSDNFEHRGPMIAAGVAAVRATLGNPTASVLVIGDTPGDIAAARFAAVDVLAVATGIYPAAQLTEADLVVSSLAELAPGR